MKSCVVIAFLLVGSCADACSPPAPTFTEEIANGVAIPRWDASWYAFLGKVVAHTKGSDGEPAVTFAVLDAWTPRQRVGEAITVSIPQWSGCGEGWEHERATPVDLSIFPIGARVRVVAREPKVQAWDIDASMVVLGTPL